MPMKVDGKLVNEKLWAEARAAVGDQYSPEKEPAKYYGTVMSIYKDMLAKREREKND
jgi:hypothetical protein